MNAERSGGTVSAGNVANAEKAEMQARECALEQIVAQTKQCSFLYHLGENSQDAVSALDRIDCTIRQGEVVVLCGQSGCGKTTYTRLLNGLIPNFYRGQLSGSHMTCGLQTEMSPIEDYVPYVGSVFQNPETGYFNARSTDELAFPCENMGMDPKDIRNRVEQIAHRFGIEQLLDRDIVTLSGGQKQQLAVAASTMLHPRVIVMDEPTGNLDAQAVRRLHDMIAQLKAEGMTIIIAEHRLAWCVDVANRFIVFEHGAVVGDYSTSDFLAIQDIEARGLRALDITPYRRAVERAITDGRASNGAAVSTLPAANDEPPIISTHNLAIGYNKRELCGRATCKWRKSIDDMRLYGGEIVGLMGHNGAGKSTLSRTLCGLEKPIAGQVLLHGKSAKASELVNAGFLVMQNVNYQLFADSAREELLLGFADSDEAAQARCDEILGSMDLLDVAQRHPMSLSGGQKQRLAIACALMCDKEVIILDEPTSGLDRLHMMQVGKLLQMLAKQGKAVLVVTHDDELAAQWCDRIVALDNEMNSEVCA